MNSKNNILLGLDADNKKLFVENNDYRHIMLIAPHGSGKGVCFVIPSLLEKCPLKFRPLIFKFHRL